MRQLSHVTLVLFGLVWLTSFAAGRPADEPDPGKRPADKPAPLAARDRDPNDLLVLLAVRDRSKLAPDTRALLNKLGKEKVPSPEAAKRVATGYKLKNGGLLAEEGTKVVGLLRLGVDVPGFARDGDLIWVVRFSHLFRGVTQEMWVSSTTGAVRVMLPTKEKPR
jgi:hypothetical protein